jgi:3-hydroxyisobutyrate dehydrogenase
MRIGFVGLGAMGAPMARNLHRAKGLAGVWNRTPDKAAALAAELGCTAYPTLAALATDCDMVGICVSADADLREVVAGMSPGLAAGKIVIDFSTVGAGTARALHAQLAADGVGFLDCPVSGGIEGARQGTLAIMAGGDEAVFERARPVLEAVGRKIAHLGPSGAGQATKATNQIMCAGIIQAVAEAMAFAHAEGLPLEQVIDTLGQGAGSSWYFVNRAPYMAKGQYPAGFRVRLHEKDLKICREMAAAHGARLPVVESTLAEYAALIRDGHGDEDISTIYRSKSALFPDAEPGA